MSQRLNVSWLTVPGLGTLVLGAFRLGVLVLGVLELSVPGLSVSVLVVLELGIPAVVDPAERSPGWNGLFVYLFIN